MKKIYKLFGLIAISMALVYGCISLEKQEIDPKTIHRMIVNGNRLYVPDAYLTEFGKGWYPQDVVTTGLNISFYYSDLKPFIEPRDNSQVWKRYMGTVSLLVMNVGGETEASQAKYIQWDRNNQLKERTQVNDRYGLQRFIHVELESARLTKSSSAANMVQDLYFPKGDDSTGTTILCSPEFQPDPDTEAANIFEKEGNFVINPMCEHYFFAPNLHRSLIVLHYWRKHLRDWKQIQDGVITLFDKFASEPHEKVTQ